MDGILVVDDDAALLRVAERVLRSHAPVLTATEPNAAREISRDRRPELAIVDLVLADSSGVDLIARLKSDRPDLKIVAYSAHATEGDIAASCRDAGAVLVEPKSLPLREVVRLAEAVAKSPHNRSDDRSKDPVAMPDVEVVERFYQCLCALDEHPSVEKGLDESLRLLALITNARLVYVELFDEHLWPRYWRGYHVDQHGLETIRASVSRALIAKVTAERQTIATPLVDAKPCAALCVPIAPEHVAGVLYLEGADLGSTDRQRAELFVTLARASLLAAATGSRMTLHEEVQALHRRLVGAAMKRCNDNISEAARELGVTRKFIYDFMRKSS